jgi:putative nucleotidyltransferase with HDIG domain
MKYTNTITVESLIEAELPPLPGSVMKISALLQDYNVSQTVIANAISLDPMLSSRLLRLANSPIFSLERTVSSIGTAVAAVGNNTISECLLIGGIGDSFGSEILNSAVGREIWTHLLATGMVAGDMCRLARLRGADEAFSGGLLHDIGKLLLLKSDPTLYTCVLELAKADGDLRSAEIDAFGFDHAEVGGLAAAAWNLPSAVCDIVRFHHEPSQASEAVALTHVINLADLLVNLKNNGFASDEILQFDVAVGFGFTAAQLDAVWEDVAIRLQEVLRTVFLPQFPSKFSFF